MIKKVIIALGNPGEKYRRTRHNAGFIVADRLAGQLGLEWRSNKKFSAELCEGGNFLIVKPQTFMNESGRTARALLSFYRLLPKFGPLVKKNSDLSELLTVIHDDLDIEFGKWKISVDSRSAGHRGVQSIINQTKTKNFRRIRIGIASGRREAADVFVLKKFSAEEIKTMEKIAEEIGEKLADELR